jgi:hypothetical protein
MGQRLDCGDFSSETSWRSGAIACSILYIWHVSFYIWLFQVISSYNTHTYIYIVYIYTYILTIPTPSLWISNCLIGYIRLHIVCCFISICIWFSSFILSVWWTPNFLHVCMFFFILDPSIFRCPFDLSNLHPMSLNYVIYIHIYIWHSHHIPTPFPPFFLHPRYSGYSMAGPPGEGQLIVCFGDAKRGQLGVEPTTGARRKWLQRCGICGMDMPDWHHWRIIIG